MPDVIPHYINGQPFIEPGDILEVYNPALGTTSGHVYVAKKQTVERAIDAAKSAFAQWSKTTANYRAALLFRYKQLLDANIGDLAILITKEHGKTLLEAMGSLQRGIAVLDFACGITNHLKGSFSEEVSKGMDCYSLRQPLGVCVGITPFNFPGMIPLWMFPLAIACGNTFILKPSEKDPSCALRLVELLKEAGVPDGVVNVIQGDKTVVDALITHPDVKAVSFVGSTPVAEYIYRTASAHHKRVQAFGGAKNHCIVMPDADIDQAADAIFQSAYGSAGERCMAISVVVAVGDKTADAVVKQLLQKINDIKIGPGLEKGIQMGPLVTKAHLEKVKSYIALGKDEGATLVVQSNSGFDEKGFYLGAYLFDHVKPSMRIYKEEIFGPVLCMMRVNSFDEALQLINEHEYGNGTAIFTNDGHIARQFAELVQVGMVGINVPVPVPVAYQSFGGWKRSIFADIGMYGSEGVRFYTKLKTVSVRWMPRTTT